MANYLLKMLFIYLFTISLIIVGSSGRNRAAGIAARFAKNPFFNQNQPAEVEEANEYQSEVNQDDGGNWGQNWNKKAGGHTRSNRVHSRHFHPRRFHKGHVHSSKTYISQTFPKGEGYKIHNMDANKINRIHKDIEGGGTMDFHKKTDNEGRVQSNWDVDVSTK